MQVINKSNGNCSKIYSKIMRTLTYKNQFPGQFPIGNRDHLEGNVINISEYLST